MQQLQQQQQHTFQTNHVKRADLSKSDVYKSNNNNNDNKHLLPIMWRVREKVP